MSHFSHVEPTGYALKQMHHAAEYGSEYPPEVNPLEVNETANNELLQNVADNAGKLAVTSS